MDTAQDFELAPSSYYLEGHIAMQRALEIFNKMASPEDSEHTNQELIVLLEVCETLSDTYGDIAFQLDCLRREIPAMLLDEVDPSQEAIAAEARFEIKLAYPTAKEFFEEAESLLDLWLKEPYAAHDAKKILFHLVDLLECGMHILKSLQILNSCRNHRGFVLNFSATIMDVIKTLYMEFKKPRAENPWLAEYLDEIMARVCWPITHSKIDLKLIYGEGLPENTHDADGTCPICKEMLRINIENEACKSKPQTIRCKTCRNIFHNQCIAYWKYDRPGGDGENVDCPLCRSSLDEREVLRREIIEMVEASAARSD